MAAEWIKQGERKLAELLKAYKDKLLVVVFYTEWCTPCRRLLAELMGIAKRAGEEVAICPIDVGETQNYHASRELKAKNVPTTVFFRKEREISRIYGLAKTEDFLHRIKCHQKKEANL